MSEITASAAPPLPAAAEKLKFYALWIAAAIVLLLLPKIFSSGGSLTTFSLIGISIIFSLSYNILLGQTGMLSFGHAVYYGLGGFLAIHAMNIIGADKLPIPLPVVPLIGGLSGLFFAALLGWVSTQRSGTAFAMISLGLAELIASSALILRSFFGGEAGISTNRTKLLKLFGWSFGPQIQIYYLVAAWTLIAVIAMYALTRTPLGRMCNAVRDNPERVQFVGYNPHVGSLSRVLLRRLLRRHRGRAGGDQFRDRQLGLSRRGTVGHRAVRHLYRRRRLLHRPDRRRDLRDVPVARPQRPHPGVAALFRADLHRGGDVRAGRHHRAYDDASPAAEGRDPDQNAAELRDRSVADAGDDRRGDPVA